MQSKHFEKICIFVLTMTALSTSSSFAGDTGLRISAEAGYDLSMPSGGSYSTFGYGGRLGYALTPMWEIGLGATHAAPTSLSNQTFIMADMLHHFSGNPAIYAGLMAGVGLYSYTLATTPMLGFTPLPTISVPTTDVNFALGGVAGYDVTISPDFSIGPRLAFIYDTNANLADFQAHANVKYAF